MDSLLPATAIGAPTPFATRPAPPPGNPAGRRAPATGGTP